MPDEWLARLQIVSHLRQKKEQLNKMLDAVSERVNTEQELVSALLP